MLGQQNLLKKALLEFSKHLLTKLCSSMDLYPPTYENLPNIYLYTCQPRSLGSISHGITVIQSFHGVRSCWKLGVFFRRVNLMSPWEKRQLGVVGSSPWKYFLSKSMKLDRNVYFCSWFSWWFFRVCITMETLQNQNSASISLGVEVSDAARHGNEADGQTAGREVMYIVMV